MRKKGFRFFASAEDGATAVEFALVAGPFVAMLFASLQTFLIFYAQQVLETAAEQGGRMILTGNAQQTGMTKDSFRTAVCNTIPALLDCSKLMIDIQTASSFSNANMSSPTITYDQQGKVSNNWAYSPGNAGQIVVMRVLYVWPVVNLPGLPFANQGSNARLMMATSVFKSESY